MCDSVNKRMRIYTFVYTDIIENLCIVDKILKFVPFNFRCIQVQVIDNEIPSRELHSATNERVEKA